MGKPEPIPAVTGPDAKEVAEDLKKPHVDPVAKRLYVGAMEEYRRAEERSSRSRKTSGSK